MVSSYYQAERLSSQKCDLAGNPTILSGKFFQTLNAKSISSVVNVASSSNDRTADVVRNAFGWNLKNTFSNERCCFALRTVAFHSHWCFVCSLLVNCIRWCYVIYPWKFSHQRFTLLTLGPLWVRLSKVSLTKFYFTYLNGAKLPYCRGAQIPFKRKIRKIKMSFVQIASN